MADAPLSRRARRALEEEAAAAAAARPVEGAPSPADAPAVDPQNLSRRDRRRLERLNNPMETWTAEEEMIATGQIPVLTPERIAEQEKIAREKAEKAAQDALLASQEFRVVTPEDLTPRHPERPEAFPEPQEPTWQASAEPTPEPPAEVFAPPAPERPSEPGPDAFAPPAQADAAQEFTAPWAQSPSQQSPAEAESSFWAPPAPAAQEPASNWRQQDIESTWSVTSPTNDADDEWDPFGERESARPQGPIAEPAPPVWTPPAALTPTEPFAPETVQPEAAEPEPEPEPASAEDAGPAPEPEAPAQDTSAAPEAYTPTIDFVDDEPQPEQPSLAVPVLGDAEPDVADDKEARARLFSDLFAGQGFSPEPVDGEPEPVDSEPEPDSAAAQFSPQPASDLATAPSDEAAEPAEQGEPEALSGADEIRRLAEQAISGIERAAGAPTVEARPATWGEVRPSSELAVTPDEQSHDDADFGDTTAVAPRAQDAAPASLAEWSASDWAAQTPEPMPEQSARWGEPQATADEPTQQSPWAAVEQSGELSKPTDVAPAEESPAAPAEPEDRFSWADAVAASSGDVPQVQEPAAPAWGAVNAAPTTWDAPRDVPADQGERPASAPEQGETPWHPLEAVEAPTTDVNDFTPVTAAPKPDFSQLYQTGQFPPVSGEVAPPSGQLPTAGQFPPPTGSQPTVALPGVGTPAGGVAGYTTDVTATGSIRRIEVPTQPEAREFKWLHLGVIGALVFVLGVVIYNVTMNG